MPATYKTYYKLNGLVQVDSNHVASGFSSSNYLISKLLDNEEYPYDATAWRFQPNSSTWEIVCEFTTGALSGYQGVISQQSVNGVIPFWVQGDNTIKGYISSTGSGWDVADAVTVMAASANTTYRMKLEFTGSAYVWSVYENGSWNAVKTITSSSVVYQGDSGYPLYFGTWQSYPFLGTINLDETYVKIDGDYDWRAVVEEEPQINTGSISVSKGYYNSGTATIIMTDRTVGLSDLKAGQTVGCKNNSFAISYNDVASPLISSLNSPTGTYDAYVNLNHPVYLSYTKDYIIGDTPSESIEMSFEKGESTPWTQPFLTSATSYGTVSDSRGNASEAGWKAFDNDSSTAYVPGTGTAWMKWVLPIDVTFTPDSYIRWTHRSNSETFNGTMCRFWADENATTRLTPDFTDPNVAYGTVDVPCSSIADKVTTNTIYWTKDSGGGWGGASSITFYNVVIGEDASVSTSSKGFLYDSTNDKTFWLPTNSSSQTLLLSDFAASADRYNVYFTNTTGSEVASLQIGMSAPTGVDSYILNGYVYTNSSHDNILGVGKHPDEMVIEPSSTLIENFTKVGSPTVTSYGEASGFSGANYLQLTSPLNGKTVNSFELVVSYNLKDASYTSGDTTKCLYETSSNSGASVRLSLKNGYLRMRISADGSTNIVDFTSSTQTCTANTKYWAKITYNSSTGYELLYSTDGSNWTSLGTNSTTTAPNTNAADILIGQNYGYGNGVAWPAVVYLTDWSMKVNGALAWKALEGYNVLGCFAVGSPTISDDCILSGISAKTSFMVIPEIINLSGKDFEFVTKFNLTSLSSRSKLYGNADKSDQKLITLQVQNGHPGWSIPGSGGSSWQSGDLYASSYNISTNTWYWMKLTCSSNVFTLYMSTDGTNWESVQTYSGSNIYSNSTYHYAVGEDWYAANESSPTLGSIDLKECYLKVAGTEVWRGAYQSTTNAVAVSDTNYWTYLGGYTRDFKGKSLALASMTGTDLSGSIVLGSDGNLSYDETGISSRDYNSSAKSTFSGYTITFTDTSHSSVASVNKTGTLCRAYCAADLASPYNNYVVFVTYEQYESGEITETLPMSVTTGQTPLARASYEVDPYSTLSSYTYNASTDTLSDGTHLFSYQGDYYVNLPGA